MFSISIGQDIKSIANYEEKEDLQQDVSFISKFKLNLFNEPAGFWRHQSAP